MTPLVIPRPPSWGGMFGDRVLFCPAPRDRENRAVEHPPAGRPIPCRIVRVNARTITLADGVRMETTYELSFQGPQPCEPGDQYARLGRSGAKVGPRLVVTSAPVPKDSDETQWVGFGITVE